MNKLNGITLNGGQVSDLFFNHENESVAAWSANESRENLRDAVNRDAVVFAELIGGQVTPQELADDYMERL